jgi:hypothetical protein
VSKNVPPDRPATIASADGTATLTVPAGAYGSAQPDNWMIFRVGVASPTVLASLGLSQSSWVYDITARWLATNEMKHDFDAPLDILLATTEPGETMLPSTYENGAWRFIPAVPQPGVLPPDWHDGFYAGNGGIHVLTRHLTLFTLTKDLEAPEPPHAVGAGVAADGLTLRWVPGRDNSGVIKQVTVFANGEPLVDLGPDQLELKLGSWDPSDTRRFSLREVDAAGNVSAESTVLAGLPQLIGLTLDQATGALAGRGFTVGSVGYDPTSAAPAGTVIAPDWKELRAQGSAIDLVVSGKAATVPPPAASKLAFDVVGTKLFTPRTRRFVAARIKVTQPAAVVATLYGPTHARLHTWRRAAHPGAQIFKLTMPRQVRKAGRYTVVWTARVDEQVLRRTQQVRIAAPGAVSAGPIDVVLAGDPGTSGKIALGIASPRAKLIPAELESTFALAGDANRNVGVIVVDVDLYGVDFVRDLRTLFPSIRLVAVASAKRELQEASHAGASVALPRATTPAALGQAIRGLAGLR